MALLLVDLPLVHGESLDEQVASFIKETDPNGIKLRLLLDARPRAVSVGRDAHFRSRLG